jgi:hypothetical protein
LGLRLDAPTTPQAFSTRFGSLERSFGTFADSLGLIFGERGHQVEGQVISVGHVTRDEFDRIFFRFRGGFLGFRGARLPEIPEIPLALQAQASPIP